MFGSCSCWSQQNSFLIFKTYGDSTENKNLHAVESPSPGNPEMIISRIERSRGQNCLNIKSTYQYEFREAISLSWKLQRVTLTHLLIYTSKIMKTQKFDMVVSMQNYFFSFLME